MHNLRLKKVNLQRKVAKARDVVAKSMDFLADAEKELEDVDSQIEEVINANPNGMITDHAIVRYFERILGIDIESLKGQIIPPQAALAIKTNPNITKYTVNNDVASYSLVIEEGVVVTIYK